MLNDHLIQRQMLKVKVGNVKSILKKQKNRQTIFFKIIQIFIITLWVGN